MSGEPPCRNMFTTQVIHSAINDILNNPVVEGFVDSPTEWPWSSARNYDGQPGGDPVVLYSWES